MCERVYHVIVSCQNIYYYHVRVNINVHWTNLVDEIIARGTVHLVCRW